MGKRSNGGISVLTVMLRQRFGSLAKAAAELSIPPAHVYRDCSGETAVVPPQRRQVYAECLGKDVFAHSHLDGTEQALARHVSWLGTEEGRVWFSLWHRRCTGLV